MSERRSLLVVADSLDGGLGAVTRAHARWFTAAGWSVVVAAGGIVDDPPDHFEPVSLPATTRAVPQLARAASRIRKITRATRPDVVHCHGMRAFAATVMSGRRPFVTIHGDGIVPTDPAGYAGVRRIGTNVLVRLSVGAISAAPGVPGFRFLAHASPQLHTLERMPFPEPASTPTFVWIGRVDEGKPGDEFVTALAHATRPVEGIVMGDGPGIPRLRALAEALGAPVRFVGRGDPRDALRSAWALALFSRHEAVSFVAQEAMWAGRAVVASPLPGLRWLIDDDEQLVATQDAIDAAFERLCDHGEASARGARAAERVRALLQPDDPWPAIADSYTPPACP